MKCSCHACNIHNKHQCIQGFDSRESGELGGLENKTCSELKTGCQDKIGKDLESDGYEDVKGDPHINLQPNHHENLQDTKQNQAEGKPTSFLNFSIGSWKTLPSLWISGLLLVAGLVAEDWLEVQLGSFKMQLIFFAFPYVLCGWTVLYAGFKSFCQLDFFNEFTLMTGVTVAAMFLGEWPEAVGVMLFYRLGEAISERAVSKTRHEVQTLLAAKPKLAHESATKVLVLIEQGTPYKLSTEKYITRLARYYTPVVVGAAALVAIVPSLAGYGVFSEWMYRALVLLVISCPCALVISIPLGYFGGIRAASRQDMLLKGSYVLDAIYNIKSIVLDKSSLTSEAMQELQAKGYTITMLADIAGECKADTTVLTKQLSTNYATKILSKDKATALAQLSLAGPILFVGDVEEGVNLGLKTLESADAVILEDTSANLPKLFKLAAKTRIIIWQNIIFALGTKIAFIALGVVGLSGLWEAVFADVGVSLLAILNSTRIMRDI